VDVEGASAVVTGGASGIGAAIARALAAAGARGVLVADLDGAGATAVADALAATGAAAIARTVDVADPTAVAEMVAAAEDAFGGLDIVVSNAGVGTGEGVEAPLEQWYRSYEVNVLAHVHAARAALPGMLDRGSGAFVHTCSAAGLLTMIGDAPYTVTKHAAVAFAEWLAITYGRQGIQVAALCPQGVDTPLLHDADQGIAGRAVRAAGPVLTAEQVAADVVAALDDGRFLVLPHPEVAEHLKGKAAAPDRWLAALQRTADALQA
jgi:NAD(P)-dependent dehydrogenase (short-subunit alcohol dehydrogenase family)